MLVSGFTIVRNAVKYDYPVKEAIMSILPICDEVVVLIGNSDDTTYELISSIKSDKIKIHFSNWDESLRKKGKVLAVETDKAFKLINPNADWAFYIQADEVLHEKYHTTVMQDMQSNLKNFDVEGLLFGYKHFYGSYDYFATSRDFYRNEIRIIRNNPRVCAYRDAQGFRKNHKKLNVAKTDAQIYHYGWVKHPKKMMEKNVDFQKFWHSDKWIEGNIVQREEFDYNRISELEKFSDTHPSVMSERISHKNWNFIPNFESIKNKSFIKRLLYWIEKKTEYRVSEYKNYKIIK